MKQNAKFKLKRRGANLYQKYFFNPEHIITEIVSAFDKGEEIDNSICQVVFDTDILTSEQIYDFISYYPNKLKEIKIINNEAAKQLLETYSFTIKIMKETDKAQHSRSLLTDSARKRAKEYNIPFNLTSEDIILPKICPILKNPIEYENRQATKYSPSLDRIIPELGYVKGNIQVISQLANSMKSNATKEELITFSKNILELVKTW
jgi:hypothetical protein